MVFAAAVLLAVTLFASRTAGLGVSSFGSVSLATLASGVAGVSKIKQKQSLYPSVESTFSFKSIFFQGKISHSNLAPTIQIN